MARQIAHVSSYSYNIEIIIILTDSYFFTSVIFGRRCWYSCVGCTVLIIVLHEATNWKHIYSLLRFLCYDVSVDNQFYGTFQVKPELSFIERNTKHNGHTVHKFMN